MPRPARIDEAKVEIDRFYAEHGVMPTIEGFARAMGYRSTSSAHNTVMGLVKSGYLTREERGGRIVNRSPKDWAGLSIEVEAGALRAELIARYGEKEYSKALTECRILADEKLKQI